MAKQATVPAETEIAASNGSYVDWAAISAGGILAAAISIVLFQFGNALGLSVDSYDGRAGLGVGLSAFATGVWIVWSALVSAMAGAYVAGRARPRIGDATEEEVEFRDGAHGLMVWAVATVLAAVGIGLTLLVTAIGGLIMPDSVTETTAEAANVLRRVQLIVGFATAAGAALAAAVAWFAAVLGGQHRDQGINVYEFVPAMFKRTQA